MEIEKQMPVNYNDVISRAFKRENHSDKVFFDENGYEWFTVTKKLTKHIYIDWDCETHFLQLLGRFQIFRFRSCLWKLGVRK